MAQQLVVKEGGLKQIQEEMFNAKMDELAKEDPILAGKLRSKDFKEREDGLRILDLMIKDMESPD